MTTRPPRAKAPARFKTIAGTAAIATIIALGAAGCTPASSAVDVSNITDAEKRGGSLVYLDAEIPVTAQVQSSGTWQTRALQQNITDRLLNRNPETNEFEAWIAERWEVSDDGLVYDFVIRDGVTYSDGTPLDVASVKRNLDWQVSGDPDKGVPSNAAFPREAEVTTDASSRTVTVTLPEPYAAFLGALTTWSAGLVADATIDATLEEQALFTNLIASGPFVVESHVFGKEVVLQRREGYAWAPPSYENQGEAYLDEVVITPVLEDSVRLGSIKAGQADLLRYVQPSEEAGLAAAGFQVFAKTGVGLSNHWWLRQDAKFVDDPNVRGALLVGIDREEIVDTLYTDNWSPASSVLAPGTVGYKDRSDALGYDPEGAVELLEASGWTELDRDGYRVKGGERLSIVTYLDVYDNTSRALFQAIQADLKEIGIELIIKETDYSSYSATTAADTELTALRTGWPAPDPVTLNNTYRAERGDQLRLKGSDAELERLLLAHIVETDATERVGLLGALQDHLIDNAYVIPILNDSQVYVGAPRVQGFTFSDGALPLFHSTWVVD